jgi:hypothetical protein
MPLKTNHLKQQEEMLEDKHNFERKRVQYTVIRVQSEYIFGQKMVAQRTLGTEGQLLFHVHA